MFTSAKIGKNLSFIFRKKWSYWIEIESYNQQKGPSRYTVKLLNFSIKAQLVIENWLFKKMTVSCMYHFLYTRANLEVTKWKRWIKSFNLWSSENFFLYRRVSVTCQFLQTKNFVPNWNIVKCGFEVGKLTDVIDVRVKLNFPQVKYLRRILDKQR